LIFNDDKQSNLYFWANNYRYGKVVLQMFAVSLPSLAINYDLLVDIVLT